MQLIIIIGIILITFVLILCKSNKNKSDDNGDSIGNNEIQNQKFDFKKILYGVVLFIPIFIAYYFLIALISSIPLFYIAGAESGAWAYAIILGFVGSPILTIITIIKVLSINR